MKMIENKMNVTAPLEIIKATGNPYIKEKMDLDIQVQKLKLLKSNFLSKKYASDKQFKVNERT